MVFETTTLTVEMKSKTPTNIGEFPGSSIRGALINAMVYRNCESLRYGRCDICNDVDCPLKHCFMNKPSNAGYLETNPIFINTDFVPGRNFSDTLNFSITLCGSGNEAIVKEMKRVLESWLMVGTPKKEFSLVNLTESNTTIDLSMLDKEYPEYNSCKVRIKLSTPLITNNKVSVEASPAKLIKALTTRVTAMVRTLGIEYHVPFEQAISDMGSLEVISKDIKRVDIQRKSTHHSKYQLLHGEIGEVEFSGDFSHIYPFLVIASQLSIGKECTMGFGKFSWEVLG